MSGATCAIFMMTFNLREVTKKRLGARGLALCTLVALWSSAVAAKLVQPRGRVRWRVFCS